MVFSVVVAANGNGLGSLDRELLQLGSIDLLVQLNQIDILRVFAAWIDQLINQHRAGHDQKPENDLSCSRTQILHILRCR